MTKRVAGILFWIAICLALLSLGYFGYRAAQPNVFNPIGLVSVGIGLACFFWLAGLVCKYLIKSEEFTTEAVCKDCGHTGHITWRKDGAVRKLVDSHCFRQLPNDSKIICKRCQAVLPV